MLQKGFQAVTFLRVIAKSTAVFHLILIIILTVLSIESSLAFDIVGLIYPRAGSEAGDSYNTQLFNCL